VPTSCGLNGLQNVGWQDRERRGPFCYLFVVDKIELNSYGGATGHLASKAV